MMGLEHPPLRPSNEAARRRDTRLNNNRVHEAGCCDRRQGVREEPRMPDDDVRYDQVRGAASFIKWGIR